MSGETHYKAVLDAAQVRARSFEEGRKAGLAEAAVKMGWDQLETSPGLQRFMDHVHREEDWHPNPLGKIHVVPPDRGRSPGFMPRRPCGRFPGNSPALAILAGE